MSRAFPTFAAFVRSLLDLFYLRPSEIPEALAARIQRKKYRRSLRRLQDTETYLALLVYEDFQAASGALLVGIEELTKTGLVDVSLLMHRLADDLRAGDGIVEEEHLRGAFYEAVLPAALAEHVEKKVRG